MVDISRIPESLISKTEFFDAKTPIIKVAPAVQRYDAVVINKDGIYLGIIDSRELYKDTTDMTVSKTKSADRYVVRVPRITDSTSIDDVIYYFHKARTKALPYAKNNKITGILKRTTMLKVLLSLNRLGSITVAQAMISPMIGVDIKATVPQAKSVMRDNKVNRLAVLENNKFVGIVTNYDLIERYFKPQERLPQRKDYMYNPSNITLSSAIQREPRTMDYEKSLREAVRELVENNISSLVITKGEKPIGILTELDIIIAAATSGGTEANKIFVSGLDADTYQYEDEIKDMLKAFVAKMEKMSRVKVDYISVNVKKFKSNSYEIHTRMSLGRQGVINSHITGHIFERTMSDMIDVLSKEIKKKKEIYLSIRRVRHNAHPEEEE
jgi:signal-transduction protein with cAMP-binding, CBS, and nucleotidyltransferase domain